MSLGARKNLMDERSTSALQYGHIGEAIYLPETQSWSFSRSLTQPSPILCAGATKTVVSSPLTASQPSPTESKSLLPKLHPDLAGSWAFVRNQTLSHVVTTTSKICDPQVSSLFDLGHAVDFENDDSGSRVIPIAVVASGECGNAISFRKIEEDSVELRRQETTTRVRVPSIGDSESAEWSACGAPVRQICFARTVEEKATWMAARFPRSTVLFRPVFHRNPVPLHRYDDGNHFSQANLQNSRLDPNPLVEISNSQTGGFAHADVTFNPWYQKQFGIVDEQGNWSIWEISGRHRRHKANWTTECVKSGSLPWIDTDDNPSMDIQPRHDGWAVIKWAGDVGSFIVSDRRCPILYRMESDQVRSHPIELKLKRRSEWILDIQRSTGNVSHVFILTTSRIFLLDINLDTVSASDSDKEPSLYPRLSWHHFRDPEDTTLKLSPLLVNEDLYLILYSRLNHFVLVFQYPMASEAEMYHTISIPDPFILDIPLIPDDVEQPQASQYGTQFSTLIFKEIAHSPASGGKGTYDPNTRLIKLFTLDPCLSVHESVYTGPTGGNDIQGRPPGRDILRVKKRYSGAPKKQAARDDFIVDDWDESALGTGTFTVPETGISSVTPLAIPQWTIDYTPVYSVATGKLIVASSGETYEPLPDKGFKESVMELENRISRMTLRDYGTSETMLELLGAHPFLDDIDQNGLDLEQFISSITSQNQVLEEGRPQFVVLPPTFSARSTSSAEDSSKLDLIHTYDSLVNDWLSNLSHAIPGRTRIMKEKVIRGVAADVILARINMIPRAIGVSDMNNDAESSMAPMAPNNVDISGAVLGRRASLPSAVPTSSEFEVPGSSALPRSDSVPRGESHTGTAYPNLSSLTTFNIKRSVARNVANMLSHWSPGTNPDDYDWQRLTQALENEESRRMSNPTTPRRRLRKKPSKGAGLDSPAMLPASSAVPVVRQWGSQPDNEPPRLRLHSSQAVDEDLPMTQVERGIFGGREASKKPAMKARKKKRAAGF